MKAAILNFENSIKENKILVLGDMFELGSFSNREHQDIINYIENKDYIKVYLVGVNFYECITSKKKFEKYRSTKDMSNSVRLKDFKSMNILIKGSRVIGLEALISV